MKGSRRAILESILFSDDSTPTEKLKAAEVLEQMDGRDPDAQYRDFYADLDVLVRESSPEALAELDAAFASPVFTLEARAEETAREMLTDSAKFNAEVKRAAKSMMVEARRAERATLREAEAARRAETSAEASESSEAAPSGSGPPLLRVVEPPPGIDPQRGWTKR